jgi:N-acetylneuraminate lyase
MGVKFTNPVLMDFNAIGHFKNKKYNMLFGVDEQLVSALATGVCDGDVGSTVNYLTYNV